MSLLGLQPSKWEEGEDPKETRKPLHDLRRYFFFVLDVCDNVSYEDGNTLTNRNGDDAKGRARVKLSGRHQTAIRNHDIY